MKINFSSRDMRVLDFDIENRPLSYWYDGQPTAEVTAIAWSWVGSDKVECFLLDKDNPYGSMEDMLLGFCEVYDYAEMVTGHYIRNHDLPIINGALMEGEYRTLDAKLTHDTKNDLIKRSGLSMSQEALSAMYDLDNAKHHMTQQAWRDANRLTPGGLKLTRKRVIDDVLQHKELYRTLKEHGVLKPPKVWRP